MTHLKTRKIKERIRNMVFSRSAGVALDLPSVRELATTFDSSRITIQKVIDELKHEGIVESHPRRGLYVSRSLARSVKVGKYIFVSPYDLKELERSQTFPYAILKTLRSRFEREGLSLVCLDSRRLDSVGLLGKIGRTSFDAIIALETGNEILLNELLSFGKSIISLDRDLSSLGIPSFVFDNLWGAFEATRALIAAGHERIAAFVRNEGRTAVNGAYLDPADNDRINGYKLAMRSAKLDPHIVTVSAQPETLKLALMEILGRKQRPTAIFSYHHFLSLELISSLKSLGYQIPENMSIIDFDGAGYEFSPGRFLSTVQLDHESLANSAADYLLDESARGCLKKVIEPKILLADSIGLIDKETQV